MSASHTARRASAWAAVAALILANGCGKKGGITVTEPAVVNSVTVSPSTASVNTGSTTTLSASVSVSGGAAQTVTWLSSNNAVATVSGTGSSATVTGISAGTATITATSTVNTARSGAAVVSVVTPQTIVANPTSLTFTAVQGAPNPAARTVAMTASNGTISGLLGNSTTTSGGGWLNGASFSSNNTPSTATISVNTTALTPGTYQGSVAFGASGIATTTVNVSYTILPATGCALGTATTVALPSRTLGTIAASDCRLTGAGLSDVYRVVVGASTTLQVDMVATSGIDAFVFLLDASGNQLASNDDGGFGLDAQLTRLVPAGTYFIFATTFGNNETGTYELYVAPSGGAGSVCAIGNAAASVIPGIITGALAASDCFSPEGGTFFADFYRFTRTSTNTLTFTMTSTSGTAVDPFMYLLDAAGDLIVSDNNGGGGTVSRITRSLTAGTYFVAASTAFSNQVGGYTLSSTATVAGAAIQLERVRLPVDQNGKPIALRAPSVRPRK